MGNGHPQVLLGPKHGSMSNGGNQVTSHMRRLRNEEQRYKAIHLCSTGLLLPDRGGSHFFPWRSSSAAIKAFYPEALNAPLPVLIDLPTSGAKPPLITASQKKRRKLSVSLGVVCFKKGQLERYVSG